MTVTVSRASGLRAWLLPIHLLGFLLQVSILLPLRVAFIVAGFIVVPVALLFRKSHEGTIAPFTQAFGYWQLVTLPRWAWPWSNERDGAIGDKRGWWHENAPFGLGAYHYFSMLVWLAFRNPANNLRFTRLFGCPVLSASARWWGQEEVKDHPGMGGLRFLMAATGLWPFYGLYWVHEWGSGRALVVQIGFKGEPSDWVEDYTGDVQRQWKGFTCEINPIKRIA